MRQIARVLLVAAIVASSPAAAQSVASTTPPAPTPTALRPGDVIHLRLWPDQALSGEYAVEEDGIVRLPLLGDVPVAGRPLPELREALQRQYRALVQNGTIAVAMRFRVSVLGAVQRPGLYHVDPAMTLVQAISLAGGPAERADVAAVRIVRDGQSVPLGASTGGVDSPALEAVLRPGDRVIVPERPRPRVTWQGVSSVVSLAATLAVLALQFR